MFVKNRLIASVLGRRAVARFAVGTVAVGAAVFGYPSASWADDNYFVFCSKSTVSCQTGAETGTPWGAADSCNEEPYTDTNVCIKYDGDIVYVYDGSADGNSAIALVHIGDAGEGHVANRWCRNPHGLGSWARCNFNWPEDKTKEVYPGIRYDSDSYWVTDWYSSFSNG